MPSATYRAMRARVPCSSAVRAMIPPSPSLSARRMNVTYLSDTTIVIDQKTRETMPKTSPGVARTSPWSIENTVCSAYSELVPMSPKTTPSAATTPAPPAGLAAADLTAPILPPHADVSDHGRRGLPGLASVRRAPPPGPSRPVRGQPRDGLAGQHRAHPRPGVRPPQPRHHRALPRRRAGGLRLPPGLAGL